jgi:hypothetical protein
MMQQRIPIVSGKYLKNLQELLEQAQPSPNPRKLAISGRFLRYAKMRISEDSQRITISSKYNATKLSRNNCIHSQRPLLTGLEFHICFSPYSDNGQRYFEFD